MVTLGLSLAGVFEIGTGLAGTAASADQQGGAAGAFLSGVLATAVATPCTAPGLGAALGFALDKQRAAGETLLFFVLLDTKGRWDWTPLIGTCARDGSFRQDGPAIELQLPMMGGVTSYRLEGGTVYENGKPVEVSTDNDPGL